MDWHEALENIPAIGKRRIALHVKPAAERALHRGHPWLFEEAIQSQSFEGSAGDVAVIFDRNDKFLAVGLYDPHSQIRVRVLAHEQPQKINSEWFLKVLKKAIARREPLEAASTDGYRLVYGENDGLPGFVVDRYAQTLVVKLYSAAWFPHLKTILQLLVALCDVHRIVLRLSRNLESLQPSGLRDGLVVYGDVPSAPVLFCENSLWFSADVIHGHKTGFFFDQRDNRAKVGELATGVVLDVFAYSGGFSVYAAHGGAHRVVSLDVSRPALDTAKANWQLNQADKNVAVAIHELIVGDAFVEMASLANRQQQFDLVVIDPPSFAKQANQVNGAIRAYAQLAQLGERLVKPGGWLVTASCSSRVQADQFFSVVSSAISRPMLEVERTGHALDHPIRFPEGEYLKCQFARLG